MLHLLAALGEVQQPVRPMSRVSRSAVTLLLCYQVLSHGLACFIHKNSVLQRYHRLVMIAYGIYATAAPFA